MVVGVMFIARRASCLQLALGGAHGLAVARDVLLFRIQESLAACCATPQARPGRVFLAREEEALMPAA